ncbi:hypothetical protein LXL04_016592 [Taraxacum kok-saghyz]
MWWLEFVGGASTPTITIHHRRLRFAAVNFTMDTNHISQIWVRNMYQKFEAVYQEVDEFMNKDPVKYVENHIQTVGESVMKFCNDVMHDIIIPPLIINPATLLKENTIDKPEESSEKCQKMSTTCEEVDTNPKFEGEDGDVINKESFLEGELVNDKINPESDDGSVFEDADWGIENIVDVNMEIEKDNEFECDSNTLSRMESLVSCIENKKENEKEKEKEKSCDSSMGDTDISSCESFTSIDHENSNESTRFGYSSFALSNGSIVESSYELDDSMVDFQELEMETIDLTDKEQLVEIVEGEKVFYFPYGSERSKSYKKIITDAFMSRKKLAKEYEQLAIWCAVDQEFSQKFEKNATKSQVQDSPDSEWELL